MLPFVNLKDDEQWLERIGSEQNGSLTRFEKSLQGRWAKEMTVLLLGAIQE